MMLHCAYIQKLGAFEDSENECVQRDAPIGKNILNVTISWTFSMTLNNELNFLHVIQISVYNALST